MGRDDPGYRDARADVSRLQDLRPYACPPDPNQSGRCTGTKEKTDDRNQPDCEYLVDRGLPRRDQWRLDGDRHPPHPRAEQAELTRNGATRPARRRRPGDRLRACHGTRSGGARRQVARVRGRGTSRVSPARRRRSRAQSAVGARGRLRRGRHPAGDHHPRRDARTSRRTARGGGLRRTRRGPARGRRHPGGRPVPSSSRTRRTAPANAALSRGSSRSRPSRSWTIWSWSPPTLVATTGRDFHIASVTVSPNPSARLFWTTTHACRCTALTISAFSSKIVHGHPR